MENRRVITVLFVMLCMELMSTYAQSPTTANTTNTASPTTATAATTATTASTASPTTMTASTALPTTATTASTASPTTATTASTASPTTTTASTASPTTATTATTNAATTGTTLSGCPVSQTSVNRSLCGTQKFCVAQPSTCDPTTDASCFLASAQQQSGLIFKFELTGQSTGFIALILSFDPTTLTNSIAYVCVNNNSTVGALSAIFGSNNMLTLTTLGVTCVSGIINRGRIECTFNATIPVRAARTTNFALSVVNGTFNSTSGGLGNTNEILRSNVVNLAQPNATVINLLNNSTTTTTTAPTTTAHAITLKQSVMQALLITVAALGLSML